MQRLTKRNIKVINHDTGQQIDFPTFGKEAGEDAYNQVSNQLTSLQSQLESSIASMSEAIVTDKTLTIEDAPADAKATGDAINNLRGAVGSPLVAAAAASMTDTNKVYVYTGSETGYTNGNWYYHDGTSWVSGGVYNSVAVDLDSTLTLANKAPDSKVVGDAIGSLNEDITNSLDSVDAEIGELKENLSEKANISVEEGLEQLIEQKEVYSGNLVDMTGVGIQPNLWITPQPKVKLDNGVFYQNPFTTAVELALSFYPKDKDGNAISMTQSGTSVTNIAFANGYMMVFNVSGTTVRVYGYISMHNFEIDFKTINKIYTLSEVPDHWVINGKAKSTTAPLEYGLTKGNYSTAYVPYSAPSYVWEYKGKLTELPYIDAETTSEFTDTTKFYKLNGEIYYYNGEAWVKVQIAAKDLQRTNKNIFFTNRSYNESNGNLVSSNNRSRTLQYIPTDFKSISVDGTNVTGVELLAWDAEDVYVGTWNESTETFGTVASFTESIDISKVIALYPTYKYKLNAIIDSSLIAAPKTSDYLTYTQNSLDGNSKTVNAINDILTFDASKIGVINDVVLNGSTGLASANSIYVTTDFVDISKRVGDKILFNATIVANPVGFSVYDKGKKRIDGLWGNAPTLSEYGYVSDSTPQRIAWTVPKEAYYIRASMDKNWYSEPSDFGFDFCVYKKVKDVNRKSNLITIAHKGYGNAVYADVLYSFINAAEAGFRGVEIDVRKTQDGIYVCSHNDAITLWSNNESASYTISTSEWTTLKGKTIDSAGMWPIPTLSQIFSTLKHYEMDYFVIDLKTGTSAEVMEIARRCGVVNQIMLSYYNPTSFINDLSTLEKYPMVAIRFTPSLTNNEFETVKARIKNQLFADINASEMGYTYVPNSLSRQIPIIFSGITETSKKHLVIAAGAMANLTLQYSPEDFNGMIDLNYNQFPTLTSQNTSVSLSSGESVDIAVASDIDDPACQVYGYSSDLSVFNVSQMTYGSDATFRLSKVSTGSANFVAFTVTGEQLVIPVTVS